MTRIKKDSLQKIPYEPVVWLNYDRPHWWIIEWRIKPVGEKWGEWTRYRGRVYKSFWSARQAFIDISSNDHIYLPTFYQYKLLPYQPECLVYAE